MWLEQATHSTKHVPRTRAQMHCREATFQPTELVRGHFAGHAGCLGRSTQPARDRRKLLAWRLQSLQTGGVTDTRGVQPSSAAFSDLRRAHSAPGRTVPSSYIHSVPRVDVQEQEALALNTRQLTLSFRSLWAFQPSNPFRLYYVDAREKWAAKLKSSSPELQQGWGDGRSTVGIKRP